MVLFSRAFIRKRVISLATTASVAATSFALAQDPSKIHHVRAGLQYPADRQEDSEEQSFLSESATAMHKVMADMTIKPTGDIDREFVEIMVPHHQGAVDMVKAEPIYGRNEQLRRLAWQVVATQQGEITVVQNTVSEGKSSVAQSPGQPHATLSQLGTIGGSAAHGGMRMFQ